MEANTAYSGEIAIAQRASVKPTLAGLGVQQLRLLRYHSQIASQMAMSGLYVMVICRR